MTNCSPFFSSEQAGRVALGTWALGGGNDWGETSEEDSQATLQTALEQGIRLIDTAPIYGNGAAEERIGHAIKGRRSQVWLATKCGIVLKGGRPDHDLRPESIIQECDNSLRRLQTDYIDVYQIHWPDPKVPLAESLGTLARLQEQGKIRAIGVCNFSTEQLQQAVQTVRVDMVQGPYSLLNPAGKETAQFCAQHQISFWAYGALGGGILSGKYKKAPNLRRCDARRYFYTYYFAENFIRAQTVAARVEKLANKKQVPAAAVAFAWVLAQPGVNGVLVGARRPGQVLENLQSAQVVLSSQEQEFLHAADL